MRIEVHYKSVTETLFLRSPGKGRYHNHKGGSPRARLSHCTPIVRTPANSTHVGISTASFLIVGDFALPRIFLRWCNSHRLMEAPASHSCTVEENINENNATVCRSSAADYCATLLQQACRTVLSPDKRGNSCMNAR